MKREAVLRQSLGPRGNGYQYFTEMYPYKDVTFATHTEAYVRTHRNQWAQRVHDLQEFLYHWKGHPTREEIRAYENRRLTPDLSSLQYDPEWDLDPYDPFSPDNDESHTLFSNVQDYTCEMHLHEYIMSDLSDTCERCSLDTQLLADQSTRPLPDASNFQPYDDTINVAPPTLPTQDEIQEYVRQQIRTYRKRRVNTYSNKKKQQKKRQLQATQEQSSLLTENDTQDLEQRNTDDERKSLMVMEFDTLDEDKKRQEQDLIFDSGCTAHMWNHRAHFTSFEPYKNSNLKAACANGTVNQRHPDSQSHIDYNQNTTHQPYDNHPRNSNNRVNSSQFLDHPHRQQENFYNNLLSQPIQRP